MQRHGCEEDHHDGRVDPELQVRPLPPPIVLHRATCCAARLRHSKRAPAPKALAATLREETDHRSPLSHRACANRSVPLAKSPMPAIPTQSTFPYYRTQPAVVSPPMQMQILCSSCNFSCPRRTGGVDLNENPGLPTLASPQTPRLAHESPPPWSGAAHLRRRCKWAAAPVSSCSPPRPVFADVNELEREAGSLTEAVPVAARARPRGMTSTRMTHAERRAHAAASVSGIGSSLLLTQTCTRVCSLSRVGIHSRIVSQSVENATDQ